MSLCILGMGTAVPESTITQEEAQRIAQVLCCRSSADETWLSSMYGNTGITKRHLVLRREVVRDVLEGTEHSGSIFLPRDLQDDPGPSTGQRMKLYAEEALPLAVKAVRAALADADVSAREISHLVTVSCTGFAAPGIDIRLIEQVGLSRGTQRTFVGFMGCHGALNGLRVARALADAEPGARVLLCAVELCSLHYSYGWNPQRIVGNAIFADGAAALVGASAGEGDAGPWQVSANGSHLMERSGEAMTWTIGDHGFVMTLSKRIPELIRLHLRGWMEGWLGRHGLTIEAVGSWAVHPGGPRIVEGAEQGLGLAPGCAWASREVFSEHGNISSPTVLFVIDRLRRADAPRPCVALGFGPGLTIEAALIR